MTNTKTCHTCGLEYTGSIVDHAQSPEHAAIASPMTVQGRLSAQPEQCLASMKIETRLYVTTHFCGKPKGHADMHRAETKRETISW